jgi:hypothetical protein
MKDLLSALALSLSIAACGGSERSEERAAPGAGSPVTDPGASTDAQMAAGSAARRAPVAPTGDVPVDISATVGGRSYQAEGKAECTHTENASIYSVPAKMWSVQYHGGSGIEHLNLTVWRTAEPPDQLSFTVQTGSVDHRIDTVKGGQAVGRGTVTVQPTGDGGAFEIDGETADGTKIRATIRCQRFAEPMPAGG